MKRLFFAVRTGLEPATSAVTGRHSNQLNYRTKKRSANIDAFSCHATVVQLFSYICHSSNK